MHLGWLAAAGVIGFLGNEAVAVFRIGIGRQINSAALIELADPIIGLIITVVILGIVWQSARAVLTRMLDGVEHATIGELCHAAQHAKGVVSVERIRARWLGHRLYAEMTLAVDPALSLADARKVAEDAKEQARGHLPALESLHVEVVPGRP
jgi:divalent metal cation (Fe/Co/Zn/Cd) transporter